MSGPAATPPEAIQALARKWRAEADDHWTGLRAPRNDLDLERRGYAEALRGCASALEAAEAVWPHAPDHYPGGASVDEGVRDERWRDAAS